MTGVQIGAPVRSYERVLRRLVDDGFASRLARRDPSLWGRSVQSEAAKRLSWVDLPRTSRPLLPRIASHRDHLRSIGVERIVLCGMGGSSLAPEVISAVTGTELTVLDSSHPDMVRAAMADDLARTAIVVSSKSGGTVETDSQRRAFEHAFAEAGLDATERIIVVTDPASPLDDYAAAAGYTVFRADPHLGGRYSALSAFGLVPCGLAGAALAPLLEQAAAVHHDFFTDSVENLALRLGVLLGVAADNDVDKLLIADHSGGGLGRWIEQLIAESTGKHGRGVLPVIVEAGSELDEATDDMVVVAIGTDRLPHAPSGYCAALDLPLGAQIMLWEVATTVVGQILQINPFDQPDVESAKQAARQQLEQPVEPALADAVDNRIAIFGSTAATVEGAVEELFATLAAGTGYLAIQAYLDRWAQSHLAALRPALAKRLGRPVTFGWGPRFLHSTGQYHKGGPPLGTFLQITAEPTADLAIPGRDFSFNTFLTSQAAGDAHVLRERHRPVLRLHLEDATAGVQRLLDAFT